VKTKLGNFYSSAFSGGVWSTADSQHFVPADNHPYDSYGIVWSPSRFGLSAKKNPCSRVLVVNLILHLASQ
jgi:hypothetical protein